MTIDPHSWPLWWRISILLNVGLYNLLGNMFSAGLTPLFGLLIREFHISVEDVSHLPAYSVLALGLSNLWAMPTVGFIGKRYVILGTLLIFALANVWAAVANSYNSLLGTRILGGLAAGIIEAIGPLIVVELFPERQLSRALVVYVGMLASGSSFGPLIAGFIAQHTGSWRWFFWVLALASGLNLVGCILMLPETTTKAGPGAGMEVVMDIDYSKGEERDHVETAIPETSPTESSQSLTQLWKERSFFITLEDIKPTHNWFVLAIRPLKALVIPSVVVTILIVGTNIGWFVVTSIIAAQVLQSPPLLWGAQSIGLINLSPLVGLILGVPVGGNFADFLSRRAARRRGGVHKPEVRLLALFPGGIISPAGCLVIGLCLQNHTHWIGLACGWAMLAFGLTASSNVLLSYVVDSFPSHAGDIGVLVNVFKNFLAFGFSYASSNWYAKTGPASQFGTMAGLLWAVFLLAVPFYFLGPNMRRWATRHL